MAVVTEKKPKYYPELEDVALAQEAVYLLIYQSCLNDGGITPPSPEEFNGYPERKRVSTICTFASLNGAQWAELFGRSSDIDKNRGIPAIPIKISRGPVLIPASVNEMPD